jgi:curved DNA-binding protein CbpA
MDPAVELKDVRARAEAIKTQNHFQILGVGEGVDSSRVKAAYFGLAKQYHPDTVPPDAPPELGKLKAEVFAALGEAYRVLSEDTSRSNYLSDLKSGGLDKVDVRAILAAEETFNKGCTLLKNRRYPEALKLFEECIAANPEEGEFYAWRGYARYIVATDRSKAAGEAKKDLNEALRRNPRCAPAHYFSGMIAKMSGDPKAARRHFQSTVDLDANHVDAQRELRMLNK